MRMIEDRPRLVVFFSGRSGVCRRIDAYLADVLQRGRNHETFALVRIDVEARRDLAERFNVTALPTYLVIEDRKVRARLEEPQSSYEIAHGLGPWLQRSLRASEAEPDAR
jgi:thioredoxin-like negative regulator of GroEL